MLLYGNRKCAPVHSAVLPKRWLSRDMEIRLFVKGMLSGALEETEAVTANVQRPVTAYTCKVR